MLDLDRAAMLERYDLGGFLPVLREAFRGDTEAPAPGASRGEWVRSSSATPTDLNTVTESLAVYLYERTVESTGASRG